MISYNASATRTRRQRSRVIQADGDPESPATVALLRRLDDEILSRPAASLAAEIEGIAGAQDAWRETCLNLLPSDNVMSYRARRLLSSTLATRVSEGMPGNRDYPLAPINHFSDRLEGLVIVLSRHLFQAKYVEWRPHTTSIANALALWSLTEPGDLVLVQDDYGGGGNFGYQDGALPAISGLRAQRMPMDDLYGFDLEALAKQVGSVRPKVLVLGGSTMLFAHPVKEMAAIAAAVGATVVYDAAHVGLLIGIGQFPHPLAEGAVIMTTGTHKSTSGPVGGLLLSNDSSIASRVNRIVLPGLIQTRDQNKLAAAAMSLTEMLSFGEQYGRAMVENANALGAALSEAGLTVLNRNGRYTDTHQLVLDASGLGALEACRRLVDCRILAHPTPLPREGHPSRGGIRFSVQELTRRGMEPDQMKVVARLISAAIDGRSPRHTQARVARLAADFGRVAYSFDHVGSTS
jgi:glycine hydroxymethyltransferase